MIRCPICREPFIKQCDHLLFFESWQGQLEGTPILKSAIMRIEVSMLHGIQNGHKKSPVPELAIAYATLRNALARGENEDAAVRHAWKELRRALIKYVQYLDSSVVVTKCDPSAEIWVPEEKARLDSSSGMLQKGMHFVTFRMSELYWSDKPKVLNEMLDHYITRWCEEFAKAADFPEYLENYFPVAADTELSYDANRLGGSDGHIPFDPSPEATIRTLRIALRAAAAHSGPFTDHRNRFLYRVSSRSRISMETAVRIIAMETSEIINAALPTIIETSKEAERQKPNLRWEGPYRVFLYYIYIRLIEFAGLLERYSQKTPIGYCRSTIELGEEEGEM